MRAWVMCRWKYSPYEGDWWECKCWRSSPGMCKASPIFSGQSPTRTPMIYTQNELAKEVSNSLHVEQCKWIWKIIPYTVACIFHVLCGESDTMNMVMLPLTALSLMNVES